MDTDKLDILSALLLSFVLLGAIIKRRGFWNPLTVLAAFYFYFAFGPVINYLFGWSIYSGTIENKIFEASVEQTLAMAGLFVAALLLKFKAPPPQTRPMKSAEISDAVVIAILLITIGFGIYQISSMVLSGNIVGNIIKRAAIEELGGGIHRGYIFIQSCVLSLYFLLRKSKLFPLFLCNFAVYIIYCVISGERDFTIIIMSIIVHQIALDKQTLRPKRSFITTKTKLKNLRGPIIAALMIPSAILILMLRAATSHNSNLALEGILNQGSILFINTQIIQMCETGNSFFWGETYLNSILNLLPKWIYTTDFHLVNWFKDYYAPTSIAGYGFALDAEAYLNFGYIGVFAFFYFVAQEFCAKYLIKSIETPSIYTLVFSSCKIDVFATK